MATRVFEGNFIKIRAVVSEKMFKEKVNARTDEWMHRQTDAQTDNRP